MDALKSINSAITDYKFDSKETEYDIAKKLGISNVSLWSKRNGKTEFVLSEVLKLSELTGKSPNELVGYAK